MVESHWNKIHLQFKSRLYVVLNILLAFVLIQWSRTPFFKWLIGVSQPLTLQVTSSSVAEPYAKVTDTITISMKTLVTSPEEAKSSCQETYVKYYSSMRLHMVNTSCPLVLTPEYNWPHQILVMYQIYNMVLFNRNT